MAISKHERAQEALQNLPALQRGPRERSIFRQKRAKGPNPLSVQKKKRPHLGPAGADEAEAMPKPKRKRSRNKVKEVGDAVASTQ